MIATGVRWDESKSRSGRNTFETITPKKEDAVRISDEKMLLTDNGDRRRLFEKCELKAKTVVNPLIDWKDADIWDFYHHECHCHNPLYDMGFTRVGCIGYPMAGKSRWKEFQIFPEYKGMYIYAFDRMMEARKRKGLEYRNKTYGKWKNGEDIFFWWMEDKNINGQLSMEFDGMDLVGFKEKR